MKLLQVRTAFYILLVSGSLVFINTIVTTSSKTTFNFEFDRLIASNGSRWRKTLQDRVVTQNKSYMKFKENLTNKSDVIKLNITLSELQNKIIGALDQNITDSETGPQINRITARNTSNKSERESNAKTLDIFGNIIIDDKNTSTRKQRQDRCDGCFKHDFRYLIENDDICKVDTNNSEITLLILILTQHGNLKQRNALRETWLTHSKQNTDGVRYAFLLGETNDTKLRNLVDKETEHFRDIIKEDFVDSYANLTYKTIMGFKWAATKCGVANFVLKTDDDVYLNIPNVLNIVERNGSLLQTHIVGDCTLKARPIRNKHSKWYASVDSYPRKFYPGYCSGTGYLSSMNVIKQIYDVSPHVPFFHLEDVYVSLCVQAIGYHVKGVSGFHRGYVRRDPCLIKSDKIVTAHRISVVFLRLIWRAKCSNHNVGYRSVSKLLSRKRVLKAPRAHAVKLTSVRRH